MTKTPKTQTKPRRAKWPAATNLPDDAADLKSFLSAITIKSQSKAKLAVIIPNLISLAVISLSLSGFDYLSQLPMVPFAVLFLASTVIGLIATSMYLRRFHPRGVWPYVCWMIIIISALAAIWTMGLLAIMLVLR